MSNGRSPAKGPTLPEGLSKIDADIRLHGPVDEAMLERFLDGLQSLSGNWPEQIVVELTTTGGDADTARRMAQEIRLLRDHKGLEVAFLGKSAVYSAGVTIMAGFLPARRFLTRDTLLLIHERHMDKTLTLKGAMRSNLTLVKDALAEIESAQALEQAGFAQLVEDTRLPLAELLERVMSQDWYLPAAEAETLGLVAGLV